MKQRTCLHQCMIGSEPAVYPSLTAYALLVVCFLLLGVFDARSATETWNPGGAGDGNGTWDTGVSANWNSVQTWTNGNDAVFTGTGGTVTLVKPSANSLTFSASGPYMLESGTLTLTGKAVTVGSEATISSAINATDGISVTGNSALTLTGSSNLGLFELSVDAATLNIDNGGTLSDIGGLIDSNGVVTVSGAGSTWTNNITSNTNLYVGMSGTGTLQITNGGAVIVTGNGGFPPTSCIGEEYGSSGAVTVSGTGSLWNAGSSLWVGGAGNGTLQITGGGTVSDAAGYIANGTPGPTAAVTVSGSGSTWTNTNGLYVGSSGSGTLLIANGGSVDTTALNSYIGHDSGSYGTVTVSGSGSTFSTVSFLFVGQNGAGSLLINNGGAVTVSSSGLTAGQGSAEIGENTGSQGAVTVCGTGSTLTCIGSTAGVIVGENGTGTLLISNGGSVSDTVGYIGEGPGSSGIATVTGTGSTWTTKGDLYVGGQTSGDDSPGLLNIVDGGSVTAAATIISTTGTLAIDDTAVLNSPVTLNGGTMTLPAGQLETVALTVPVILGAGSKIDLEFGNGSDEITFSGSGSIAATGAATINVYALSGEVTSGTDVLIGGVVTGNPSVNIYNSGNFTYLPLNTGTSEELIVTAANPLTTAYWKGGQGNVWTLLAGGTATNWTTDQAGTMDPQITPSATTDVIFSADTPANEGDTVLGTDVTIKSLTISDTNAVVISGANPSGNNTLTISGTAGITVNSGAGQVTVATNVDLTGNSQTVSVENAAGLLVSGSLAGDVALYVGGDSAGPGGAGLLQIGSGASVTATASTIWDTGTLAFGQNATLNSPLAVDGGTVTLIDGQTQTVAFKDPVVINAGSTLDLEVGNGPVDIALTGSGSLTVTGPSTVNLYGVSGTVGSGTDVLIGAGTSGNLTLGNIYNSGNFNYSLLSTSTSEDVVVTPAANPLTTAYWKGGQNNLWSILVGGTATNWTTDQAGDNDPQLTPSATTDVIFAANNPANDGYSVLGTDMTIKSLTVSDPDAVTISGADPNPELGTDTLTISGTTGATGITTDNGAGLVTVEANLYLSGGPQTFTADNEAGLLISGNIGGSTDLVKSGTGTLTLTGNDTLPAAIVQSGTLAIQGTLVSNGPSTIGETAGFSGTVTVSGNASSWTASNLLVGASGTGTLLITDGATVSGKGTIGDTPGGIGMATVSGSGSTWTGSYLDVGEYGTGTLLITNGGTATNSQEDYIGYEQNSNGTVTVSGSGSTWAGSYLDVGENGTGTLLITNGGTVTNSQEDFIGYEQNSNGTVTVTGSGSNWADSSALIIGSSGTGTLMITNGGSVSAGGAVEIGANYLGNGTVTVSGSGSILTDNSSLTIGYGSAKGLLSIASYGLVSATATTVSTKCTLEFGQNATLNSPLTVTGGTLEGSGSGSILTIGANVTLGAGSTLAIDIDASSNAADMLNITNGGSLILTGKDTLTVDLINGAQLTAEDYVIAMVTGGGTIEGEFADLNIPRGYTMDYGEGVPGEVRLVAEVVPEPGSWGMVVGGIGAVGMAGRFRRRKAGGP